MQVTVLRPLQEVTERVPDRRVVRVEREQGFGVDELDILAVEGVVGDVSVRADSQLAPLRRDQAG